MVVGLKACCMSISSISCEVKDDILECAHGLQDFLPGTTLVDPSWVFFSCLCGELWPIFWQGLVVQEVLGSFHGVDIDVDQVGGEVAWAESSTVVVVDPLGVSSDLDNKVVGFIGHVHH